MNEGKKDRRDPIRTIKARNPVAKNATAAIGGGAAGAHKDKKKAMKQGEVKHKNQEYAEHLELSLRKAVTENFDAEYDDEAGMADNNLETLKRAVDGIDDVIQTGDNLPEWCQEKIAVAKSMLVTVWDYMLSEKDSEKESFDIGMGQASHGKGTAEGIDHPYDRGLEDGLAGKEYNDSMYSSYEDKESYRRGRIVAKQQAKKGVSEGESAREKWNRASAEREKKHNDAEKEMNARHARGEEDMKGAIDRLEKHVNTKEGLRDPKDNPCWKGYKPVGTKKKGGKTVPNCVPKEGWTHDSLAAQLFETENTYEDRLNNLLNKRLGK